MTTSLLHAFDLRGLTLPNRVVMAPMTRARATTGVPDQLTAEYYAQRASAGLIISEGAPVSPEGNGWLFSPGFHTPEQVAGWQGVTAAVRARSGRIFAQLWHVGRSSHVSLQAGGRAPVSSTTKGGDTTFARTPEGTLGFIPTSPPRALRTDEIPRLVQDFVTAAANADAAGFHGVEIHGATRYLFEQFLNAAFNDRTDRYGVRTLTDRLRLILEVVDAVAGLLGPSRVGVRLSPFSTVGGMPVDELADQTYRALVRELADREVAYVHIHNTVPFESFSGHGDSIRGAQVRALLEEVRPDLGSTAMVLAGGLSEQSASQLVDDGVVDLAAFGRPFISNPDLVERLGSGAALAEADPSRFYGGAAGGYTDYPRADVPAGPVSRAADARR